MLHYSFTTKKTRTSRREEFGALNEFRYLVHYGGRLRPPLNRFSVRLHHIEGGAMLTLMRGGQALMAYGLAWNPVGERVIWNSLRNLTVYLGEIPLPGVTPKGRPVPPERLPWTGEVVLPGWRQVPEAELGWVADFLTAMAWLVWETRGGTADTPAGGQTPLPEDPAKA